MEASVPVKQFTRAALGEEEARATGSEERTKPRAWKALTPEAQIPRGSQ